MDHLQQLVCSVEPGGPAPNNADSVSGEQRSRGTEAPGPLGCNDTNTATEAGQNGRHMYKLQHGPTALQKGIPPEGAGMFVLAEMQDVIRIEPHQFKFDMQRQIVEELNKKLANKVHPPDKCMRIHQ